MTTQTASIAARAMLASLTISQWSARKLDKTATRKTTDDAAAIAEAGRFNKNLLAGQDACLKAVSAIASAARADFYAATLPWSNDGPRILPADLWASVNAKLQDHAQTFYIAVNDFLTDYAQSRDRARFALGSMFRESDFPSVPDVRAKFAFAFEFDPLPTSQDFRVTLADDDADMLRKDIEARAAARYAAASRDAWQRLYAAVERIAVTLPQYATGEVKRFNDSLTGNLDELVAILPSLNITQDPQLTAMTDRVKAELAHMNPQTLRDSDHARDKAANSAAAICRTMAATIGLPAPAFPEVFTTPPATAPAQVFDLFAPAIRAA
jgi:hypothetical protein